ncbi:MAG: ubiquitin-like domain-containing protein [Candidatus Baldrarchaeia archaeon]
MKVRIISALGGNMFELDVAPGMTVGELKEEVSRRVRVPSRSIVLVHKQRQLQDSQTLSEAGVQDYDKIYIVVRTEGG